MIIAAVLAGVAAGYAIAVPVGAIAVLIAGLSARNGLRVGAAAGLGAATADGLYALLAVLGGTALAAVITPYAVPLRWLAAIVLLGIAVQTAYGAIRRRVPAEAAVERRPASVLGAYLGVLGLTLLNPATVVYFAALVLGRGGSGGGGWFAVGAFAASASWQLLIAAGGSLVGRLVTSRRGQLVTAMIASIVIAALAIRIL